MNLDQTRAATAYGHIKDFASADEERNRRYGTLALKLPALIRTAGLCQALHFIHARAKGDASKPEMHLLGHLAKQGVVRLVGDERVDEVAHRRGGVEAGGGDAVSVGVVQRAHRRSLTR